MIVEDSVVKALYLGLEGSSGVIAAGVEAVPEQL